MRIVRLIIISILLVFFVVTIISLFIPSNIRISRAIQINSRKDSVMNQISDPKKWRDWYPDADSSKFYFENGHVRGLILDESKHQYIILKQITEDEVTAIYTLPGKEVRTGWQVLSTTGSTSVTVQWYMDFHLRWYPWEKFSSFIFEKLYHPQLQKGLDSLKKILED
jgi:hypothetical protein